MNADPTNYARVCESVKLQRDSVCVVMRGTRAARVFGADHLATTKAQELMLYGIEDKLAVVLLEIDRLMASLHSKRAAEVAERLPLVRLGQGAYTVDLHDAAGKLHKVRGGE